MPKLASSPRTRLSAAIHNLTDRKYWLWSSVQGVAGNLASLDQLLSNASNPDALAEEQDSSLLDREPRAKPLTHRRSLLQTSSY